MGTDVYDWAPGTKLVECICLTHSCYDAQPKLVRAATKSGLKLHLEIRHIEAIEEGITLCGKESIIRGHVTTTDDLVAKLNLCSNCKRAWLKL